MQLTTMPATTIFKSKWNTVMDKLSNKRCRPTTSFDDCDKRRKQSSDAISVGTLDSTVSMADKVRQALPFFRRRSSSNISHEELVDTKQEYEKLQELYTLAVDELNYAEDSQGSSYYSGDLTTARDALDDCANAFLFILQHLPESEARESLQTTMTPKLFKLQIRLDALPEPDDTYDY